MLILDIYEEGYSNDMLKWKLTVSNNAVTSHVNIGYIWRRKCIMFGSILHVYSHKLKSFSVPLCRLIMQNIFTVKYHQQLDCVLKLDHYVLRTLQACFIFTYTFRYEKSLISPIERCSNIWQANFTVTCPLPTLKCFTLIIKLNLTGISNMYSCLYN